MKALIAYATVHGPCDPTLCVIANPAVFGNLDVDAELRILAGKLGVTEYEIHQQHGGDQLELFPRPTLEHPSCQITPIPKRS